MELKASSSQEAKDRAIRAAVDKHYAPKHKGGKDKEASYPSFAWVKDVVGSHVVVESGDKLFAHKFTMKEDGGCSLGKGVEVQVIYRQKV